MHVGSYVTHASAHASLVRCIRVDRLHELSSGSFSHAHVRQQPVDEIELSNFELAAARRGTDPSASLRRRLARQRIRGGARLDAPLLASVFGL